MLPWDFFQVLALCGSEEELSMLRNRSKNHFWKVGGKTLTWLWTNMSFHLICFWWQWQAREAKKGSQQFDPYLVFSSVLLARRETHSHLKLNLWRQRSEIVSRTLLIRELIHDLTHEKRVAIFMIAHHVPCVLPTHGAFSHTRPKRCIWALISH